MNRLDLNDPEFRKECIEAAKDPKNQKRYGDLLQSMVDNARNWKSEHPKAEVKIQWNFPPKSCVIAPISVAIDNKIVTVNDDGLALLKALAPWGDDSEPTVAMCRSTIEHVYDPVVPEDKCPHCGKTLDDATSVGVENAKPTPGDISICIDCAGFLQFDGNLKLIKMDDGTWNELGADLKRILTITQQLIKETNKL